MMMFFGFRFDERITEREREEEKEISHSPVNHRIIDQQVSKEV
jgi:hypothetical protein